MGCSLSLLGWADARLGNGVDWLLALTTSTLHKRGVILYTAQLVVHCNAKIEHHTC